MNTPTISELTDRAREIFRLVVEGYLTSGQPVGSKTLAGQAGLNLSPASIRSVLSDLEQGGLLAAPHTSAGRMPTEQGLRLFVDGIMQAAEPTPDERAAIERGMAQPGPIEAALEATSAVLSDLSACAGVVMVPRREQRLSQLSLMLLSPGKALAVLVGEDGAVENRILDIPLTIRPGALDEAANYISAQLAGRTLREAAQLISRDIASGKTALDEASRGLVERGCGQSPGPDRAWAGQSARRNGTERYRARAIAAR
jgi:heat-inducible transcriptional repressor